MCVWVTEYLSVCVRVSAVYQSKTAPSCQCAPICPFSYSPGRQWLSVSVVVEVRDSSGPAAAALLGPAPAPGPVSVCAILFLCANHAASLNLFAV